jgi:hypothetical protein
MADVDGQPFLLHVPIWSKNFSHSTYEKSEANMAAIDGGQYSIALMVVNSFYTISPQLNPVFSNGPYR